MGVQQGDNREHRILYVESDPETRESLADYLEETDDVDSMKPIRVAWRPHSYCRL